MQSLKACRAVGWMLVLTGAPVPLHGVVIPVTTTVRGVASANVQPNPEHPADSQTDTGTTGSFSVTAHDSDTATDANGTLLSDVSITGSAEVSADGASGTANLDSVWIATNSKPVGSPNQGGLFSINMRFFYSFITDEPVTIVVDVNTVLGGTGDVAKGLAPMSVNHAITFDGIDFVDISLNGPTHAEYSVGPGAHQFQIDHVPNSGISPWPNVTMTFDSDIAFSIVPDPATALLLGACAAPLGFRRRRVG